MAWRENATLTLPAWVSDWWKPIETAPDVIPILVSNLYHWTVAKRVCVPYQTLQLRWPIIKSGAEWRWVYACSNYRRIDFEPTVWMPPPPGPRP